MKPTPGLVPVTLALALAIPLMIPAFADATVVRYLELNEHVEDADLVVRARAGLERRIFRGADGRPRTETPFEIVEVYKGSAKKKGDAVRLRQLGGILDGQSLSIGGDASFRESEEVVLFLRLDDDDPAVVYLAALGQSKYEVKEGLVGLEVERDLGGLGFYVEGGASKVVPGGIEAPVPLDLFARTIAELAATKGGAK